MNDLFEKAILFVMSPDVEGGYSNNKNDAGGETKFGISKKSHPDVDIKNLTPEKAKEIYKKEYWSKFYDQLNNPNLAIKIFDMSVNSGEFNAHKTLQKSINYCGGKIQEDGMIGKETVNAANQIHTGWLFERFRVERYNYYLQCWINRPINVTFMQGWMKRAYL